jgi:hypothetical protein
MAIPASTIMHRKLLEGLVFAVNAPGLSTPPQPNKTSAAKVSKADLFEYLAKLLYDNGCFLTLITGYSDARYTGTILYESMREQNSSKNFTKNDTSENSNCVHPCTVFSNHSCNMYVCVSGKNKALFVAMVQKFTGEVVLSFKNVSMLLSVQQTTLLCVYIIAIFILSRW